MLEAESPSMQLLHPDTEVLILTHMYDYFELGTVLALHSLQAISLRR